MASLPIPHGVEILMDDAEIQQRIDQIKAEMLATNNFVIPEELRRLVSELSHRELIRLGVI